MDLVERPDESGELRYERTELIHRGPHRVCLSVGDRPVACGTMTPEPTVGLRRERTMNELVPVLERRLGVVEERLDRPTGRVLEFVEVRASDLDLLADRLVGVRSLVGAGQGVPQRRDLVF